MALPCGCPLRAPIASLPAASLFARRLADTICAIASILTSDWFSNGERVATIPQRLEKDTEALHGFGVPSQPNLAAPGEVLWAVAWDRGGLGGRAAVLLTYAVASRFFGGVCPAPTPRAVVNAREHKLLPVRPDSNRAPACGNVTAEWQCNGSKCLHNSDPGGGGYG